MELYNSQSSQYDTKSQHGQNIFFYANPSSTRTIHLRQQFFCIAGRGSVLFRTPLAATASSVRIMSIFESAPEVKVAFCDMLRTR